MPATRSSARRGNQTSSSPPAATTSSAANGNKRKAGASPAQAKKGRKSGGGNKKQKTIEETLPDANGEQDDEKNDENGDEVAGDVVGLNDQEMDDAAADAEEAVEEKVETGTSTADQATGANAGSNTEESKEEASAEKPTASAANGVKDAEKDEEPSAEAAMDGEGEPKDADKSKITSTEQTASNAANADSKPRETEAQETAAQEGKVEPQAEANGGSESKQEDEQKITTTATDADTAGDTTKTNDTPADAEAKPSSNDAVEESKERADAVPSNVLEKGIIYFFTRGRVGVEEPQNVQDLQRSYIVLRPLPTGAKLGDGIIEDRKNNRLLAIPKKVLPKSGRDQFLSFVEKTGVSIAELKEDFMKGSDYNTKTTGVRHTPAAAPVGEGVYVITDTGRDSYLSYMLTIPSELGEVQNEMGIQQQGSVALSVKNPQAPGPGNYSLPQGADYPKEVQEEFGGLRWMGLKTKHLDYEMTQILLIGQSHGGDGFGKALNADAKDEKNDAKETPQEELEKLEEEDHVRVDGLKGDEAESVFADLKLNHEEYPKLLTTW